MKGNVKGKRKQGRLRFLKVSGARLLPTYSLYICLVYARRWATREKEASAVGVKQCVRPR